VARGGLPTWRKESDQIVVRAAPGRAVSCWMGQATGRFGRVSCHGAVFRDDVRSGHRALAARIASDRNQSGTYLCETCQPCPRARRRPQPVAAAR
jgi:hypothetical protein